LKKYLFLNILFLYSVSTYGLWQPSLIQNNNRYFMPIEGQFEPDPVQIYTPNGCLSYDNIPVQIWTIVDFDLGVIFFYETFNGTEIYVPRAVPIDSLIAYMQWDRQRLKAIVMASLKKKKGTQLKLDVGLPPEVEGLIGPGGAGLNVNGRYKITLGGRSEWSDREAFFGSKWPQLQMEQESNFKITGTIGSKIKVSVDQDSKRTTDLENTINIRYAGEEDDVVQSIEAGNTTLSLPGPSLIGYSERIQGLFGIKSVFQVGDWNITAIASQEKANTQSVTVRPSAVSEPDHIYDHEYKHRTYYWMGIEYALRTHDTSDDSISFFEVYYANNTTSTDPNSVFGRAYVQPIARESDIPTDSVSSDSLESGYFIRINPMDYFIDRKSGWFRLNSPAGRDDIVGVRYIISHSDGSADTSGFFSSDSTLYLRMIKPSNLQPDHPCWEYEWRNVYDIGKTDIRLEETFIKLFRKVGTDSSQALPENNNVFLISLFGMDEEKLNGDPGSDGYVDQSPYYIDAARGELIFTVPHPFDPGSLDIALEPELVDFPDTLRNPAIYTSTQSVDWERNSNCFLYAETRGFSTVQSLGSYNIIAGSEVVKLNGEKLKRDIDYKMYYEIGQIRFISEKARDPNASIEITFESQPFISMQQKTLLGSRIQYDLGEDSWFGITGLYKSVTTPEQRPRVGGEPSRAFLWDVDLRLSQEIPFLTSAIDALPLIQTDSPSKAVLKLETAQILSNPNTLGKAYVDDFEGSKSSDPISITRTIWTPSSAPYDYLENPRAKIIWYNPYDKIPVNNIWPNRDVTSENSTTDVLKIEFHDTTGGAPDTSTWGGIIQHINPAYQDQQNSQFFEIWVHGDEGILTIDMGKISEDIDGDGELDTEDKEVGGKRDNILAPDEDTGIDGMTDDEELNYYLDLAGVDTSGMTTDQKKAAFGEIYPSPNWNPDDPSGDNWSYPSERDYAHINGTQGNIDDPIGLRKPDTEDLNHNGVLDGANDYYEFQIDLSSTHFEVPGTRSTAGWRLYRIPLQDSTFTFVEDGRVWHRIEINDPDLTQINYIRLWLTNISTGDAAIEIAQMGFVRNQWREDFDHFEIAVKNTHEDMDYYSPEGAGGERNATTGEELAEQALALKYKHLPPLDTVYAEKTIPDDRADDYTQYKKMVMWVNYSDTTGGTETPPILFFRMGDNQGNYYEYRTNPLDTGWAESNKIVIEFDSLTAFKEEFQRSVEDTAVPDLDSLQSANNGNGYYLVSGNPTLTKITMFELGIINPDQNFPISGEVWCDELMVEDVRQEDGKAYLGEFTIQAADFANFVATVRQQDDDFHGLSSQKRSSSSYYNGYSSTTSLTRSKTLTQNYTSTFSLGKFFPIRVGINLPLALSYQHQTAIPRFKTGSDVFLPDSLRDVEKTVQETEKVSLMGVGISPKDPSPIVALLVSPNRISYSWSKKNNYSPSYPEDKSSTYTIQHTYNLAPKSDGGKVILKKGETDSTGKGIGGELAINYVPSKISFQTSVVETKTHRLYSYGTITDDFLRTLSHQTTLQHKPINTLTADFSLKINRDIHKEDWFNFGPPTILGEPQRKTVNDGLHWRPIMVNWLTQSYGVTSTYTENTTSNTGASFGQVSQNRTLKSDYTIKWNDLLGKSTGGKKGGASAQGPVDFKSIAKKMDNLKLSYSWNGNTTAPNLISRPGHSFQFGLTDDPGVPSTETSEGTQRPSQKFTNRFDASTGYKFPYDIHVTTKYNLTTTKTINTSQNTKVVEQTFPDISSKWGFFKKLKFIKKFANSASANSNWSHKNTKNYTADSLSQSSYSDRFNPLLGMNFNMKGGWTLDLKANWERQVQATYTGVIISYSGTDKKTFDVTARYTLRAKKGLKIPLIGTLTLENTLTLTLNASYSTNNQESWTEADKTRTKSLDKGKFSIKPQANYNLSKNAVAGIEIEITEDKNKIINSTTHIRDVKIWVQFQFGSSRGFGGRGYGSGRYR